MSYPLSSDVSAGDATLSAHYNNLRADALRFGQAAADSVNIGQLLEAFESKLKIERLNTTQIRIPCSAADPVDLVIAGCLIRSVANVDLAIGYAPTGAAQTWYVFANRAASSTTFTLSIATSPTEVGNQRRIGRFYFNGTIIVKDSCQTEYAILLSSLLYFKEPHLCNGRLTLSSGVPVPTTDVTDASYVYFTPYKGNRVSLYVPTYGWRVYTFSELFLDISGYTSGKPYDIFLYDNAGTLALEGVAWSNITLRAFPLIAQDGAYVKTGALDHLYLGTIYMTSAGGSSDSLLKRCCWNNYNRILRQFYIQELTESWTYAVAEWRKFNNSAANKVEFVIGLNEEPINLIAYVSTGNSSAGAWFIFGIGLDSETVPSCYMSAATQSNLFYINTAIHQGYPGIGYHYLQLLEYVASGVQTIVGKDYADYFNQSGATGWIIS